MKKTPMEAVVVPAPEIVENPSVFSLISFAIEQKVPVETLERLYALREKMNAETAEAAYNASLSQFQSNCPIIEKTKSVFNKDGRTVRYKFASLDSIIEQIKAPLAASSLSYRWETKQENGNVTAICFVTHSLGHTRSSDFTVGVDTESYMTSPQKAASALTFAKRYSLCNALGIATGDEDTDATDVKPEKDAKDPKSRIMLRLRTLGEKTNTKEDVEEAVKRRTTLVLDPENFEEIVTRLDVVIAESHENTEIH